MKYIIYGLVDPITEELRYIGRSSNGWFRPRNHGIPSSLKHKNKKNSWLKSLRDKGFKPQIILIEDVKIVDNLNESEEFWICYYKSIGCRLTNLSAGGGGTVGYRHTSETKEKISKNNAKYNAKPVIDQFGNKYPSATAAAISLGVNKRSVDRVCRPNNRYQSVKGRVFRYLP